MKIIIFIAVKYYSTYMGVVMTCVVSVSYDDPNCVIDSSKPATAAKNYINCFAELQVKLGRTECCTIDGDKGCCKPGDR